MSDARQSSWDDGVEALRKAVNDLRSAAGGEKAESAEEQAAAERLKADVTRLEEAAANLRTKLAAGFDAQREEFETAVDRDRAEQSVGQLRSSLDELVAHAKTVGRDLGAVAKSSATQAEPELKTAIRTLEDVAGSAASWIKAVIDPNRPPRAEADRSDRPPLDEL